MTGGSSGRSRPIDPAMSGETRMRPTKMSAWGSRMNSSIASTIATTLASA
jgi:hypothetical protein